MATISIPSNSILRISAVLRPTMFATMRSEDTFEHVSTKRLFSFLPNEVSFRASEFIGLTEEEAHNLFQRKDTSFLRS